MVSSIQLPACVITVSHSFKKGIIDGAYGKNMKWMPLYLKSPPDAISSRSPKTSTACFKSLRPNWTLTCVYGNDCKSLFMTSTNTSIKAVNFVDPTVTRSLISFNLKMSGIPLVELFKNARKACADPAISQQQLKWVSARQLLDETERCVRAADIQCSANEELQDIATQDLQFLTLPFMQAHLWMQRPVNAVNGNRVDDLKTAKKLLLEWWDKCRQLGLATRQHVELMEQISNPRAIMDVFKSREEKIKRFKSQRELRNKLAELEEKRSSIVSADDELIRELYLTEVMLSLENAIDNISLVDRELEMIETHQASVADSRSAGIKENRIPNDEVSARLDPHISKIPTSGPLMDTKGKPLRPFTITSKREDTKAGVFRPGHRLPTMSIDEYLDKEFERGNVLSGGTKGPEKKVWDDNDENALDAETLRLRNWDIFKEDNPRGAGNMGGNRG